MYCNRCGNKLPDNSDFCPYCMNKNVEETDAPILEEKSFGGKRTAIIIAASALVIIITVTIVLAVLAGNRNTPEDVPQRDAGLSETETVNITSKTEGGEDVEKTQTDKAEAGISNGSTAVIKTTSAPESTVRKTSSRKEQIKSKYKEIIRRYAAEVPADYADDYRYYIYDINDDGVKELITEKYGSSERDFYTYKNGKEVFLGSFNLSNTEFMIPRDGNGLLMCFAHMDYCSVSRLTISDNDAIKETYIDSADNVQDYYKEFAMYAVRTLEGHYYYDYSALNSL
ncbi:MAG: zinc ribbon domain-containing protein [Clostridia bacterium]|nr:zinc ribbon domain-containing protein [Clostridia bacterium]